MGIENPFSGKFDSNGGPDTLQCPKCGYPHASLRNFSRRATTATGTLFGGAAGVVGGAFLLGGAETGIETGAGVGFVIGGPTGSMVGAILGGLSGAAIGAFSGHMVGKLVDKDVVGIYGCPQCNYEFLP